MKEIRDLKTTQIRIFPIDEIGFRNLQRSNSIKHICNRYNLKFASRPFEDIVVEPPLISFINGEFRSNEKIYLIDSLIFEARRIIITMSAPTEIIESFFDNLRRLLIELDLREQNFRYEPVITSNETTCIVKMDFSLHDLFEKTILNDFQNYFLKKIESHGAKVDIIPSVLRFKIYFLNEPEELQKKKITLSEKEFAIEVRERTHFDDKIYFTSSPTDSKTHLELLSKIEQMMKS